jgi:peroxiredoxin Q/BCP|tara:strand:- start:3810 stop:4283 length:474 start_codon:yes stop_codon:yes gene_type:complete
MSISIGQSVPQIKAPATSQSEFNLDEHKGQFVVLYFYPKDDTPGCTTEGHDFNNLLSEFETLNCKVYGISRDSIKKHEKFKAKHTYNFELISDESEALCAIFDVIKLKKLYGKEYMGIDRSTFLISPDGILIQEWRSVKVPQHAQLVLDCLNQLATS